MARSEATKLTSRQLLSQAEPLGKTSQSTSVAFLIVIDPKIRVFQHRVMGGSSSAQADRIGDRLEEETV